MSVHRKVKPVTANLLAQDVFRLGRLPWVMETSMLKTLAGKHRSTLTKMPRKYKSTIETPDGPLPESARSSEVGPVCPSAEQAVSIRRWTSGKMGCICSHIYCRTVSLG